MRYYQNASEMYNEVRRDLAEMGITTHPKTMQDKNVEGNEEYATKELQNYSYTLLQPTSMALAKELPVVLPWAEEEFLERIDLSGTVNPGEAYKSREAIWNEYMHEGKFAYSYNERFYLNQQLPKLIERLKEDPDSRQIWLSVWNPNEDPDKLGGISRVPCSLGYNFQVRNGRLNCHYVMRSCDFVTHFSNDVYLAVRLMEYISHKTGYPMGNLTHTCFSLHVYMKDIKGVF